MKNKTLIGSILLTITCLFINCSGDKQSADAADTVAVEEKDMQMQEQDVTKAEAGKPQFTVDEIFRKQLTEVFDKYVELKETFVSYDADKVKNEAGKTKEALAKVDMKLVSGEAHNNWMSYQAEIEKSLSSISSGNDIEAQRAGFSDLSTSLYKTIKAFGLSGATAYYDFCPMAFNDKGAHWLSKEEKIRNPYFGDKMLTCGSIEETLQ